MNARTQYKDRVLVSFRGRCPLLCKHCYTYDLDEPKEMSIHEIVQETGKSTFDIIYLSQKYENFFDESNGLKLCQELYDTFQKDIFIITRSYLSDALMGQLQRLNLKMREQGNQLYIAVSLCADRSYAIAEDPIMCPSPSQRLENLHRGHDLGIKTLLLLRPVFPDSVIPVKECICILEKAKNDVDAVISSGLIVTDNILARLGLENNTFTYKSDSKSEYLSDIEDAKYLDVEMELSRIKEGCRERGLPFFEHSMPALNYLAVT